MPGSRYIWLVTILALVLVVLIYLLFSTRPNLDMDVTRSFYFGAEDWFAYRSDFWVRFARRTILYSTTIFYVATGIIAYLAWRERKTIWRFAWHQWSFLLYCGLAGPVLISNVLLKGNWDRARPQDVTEFGGTLDFTPFWVWSDQCSANCSFVSGEVSGVIMIFLSLVMITRHRFLFWALAIVAGAVTAWIRVAQGSHFLSDTLMALPLMMLSACAVYALFYLGKGRFLTWVEASNRK